MTSSNTGAAFWSGEGGRRWLAGEAFTARAVGHFGDAALAAAAPRSGERIVDIGCGTGVTTLQLGRAVGASGAAVGIDVSPDLLAVARERAAASDAKNVSFVDADAETQDLGREKFDLVYSRFGVMFFADPTAAFARMRTATKRDGRLAFVCWARFKDNPWGLVPFAAAAPHLPPMPPLGPEDPGPYSFGDPDRVRRILDGSGWTQVELSLVERPIALAVAGGVEEAASFCGSASPVSRLLANAPEAARERAVEAIRAALAPHAAPYGRVELPGRCWLVTARASEIDRGAS
jgi:SAM-dependent methyltransferase